MLEIELEFEITTSENYMVFKGLTKRSTDDLTEEEKLIYDKMIDLIPDMRIKILNTPNEEEMAVYRYNVWWLNEDKSIGDNYPRIIRDFNDYNEEDRQVITNFIDTMSNK